MGCPAGPIAVFNFSTWSARFPEFTDINESLAQSLWNEATVLWNNTGGSPASSLAIQSVLLNLMTAHLAALYVQSNSAPNPGQPTDANGPVGRISSATQGSVSVSTEMNMPASAANQAWLNQTKYGAEFWALTAQYRTMRYIPGAGASRRPGYPNGAGVGPGPWGFGGWGWYNNGW